MNSYVFREIWILRKPFVAYFTFDWVLSFMTLRWGFFLLCLWFLMFGICCFDCYAYLNGQVSALASTYSSKSSGETLCLFEFFFAFGSEWLYSFIRHVVTCVWDVAVFMHLSYMFLQRSQLDWMLLVISCCRLLYTLRNWNRLVPTKKKKILSSFGGETFHFYGTWY